MLNSYHFAVCGFYLGVSEGYRNLIPQENIKASSTEYESYHQPWLARLNGQSFWAGSRSDSTPWIQADLGYSTNVSGVVTQGDGRDIPDQSLPDWVTSIKVSTLLASTNDAEVFIKDEAGIDIVSKY